MASNLLYLPSDNPWLGQGQKNDLLALPKDLILLIFIHGFRGSESTFSDFPGMLQRIVSESNGDLDVESIIFPTYSTRGELDDAVKHFTCWLTALVKEKEVGNGKGWASRKVKVVLCGHSMGGLVAADTLIGLVASRPENEALLWPRIIACIALDTPYLGLGSLELETKVTKALRYVHGAHQVASTLGSFFNSSQPVTSAQMAVTAVTASPVPVSGSLWATWAAQTAYTAGGLLLSGVAAGAAYYKRDNIGAGYKWATDHLKYIGTLWDKDNLTKRMEKLEEIENSLCITFRNLYTLLPAQPPDYPNTRTFVALPPNNSPLNSKFLPAQNNFAKDEIQAHTGMFKPDTNDGYHRLGLEVEEIVRGAINSSFRVDRVEDIFMTFNPTIPLLYHLVN